MSFWKKVAPGRATGRGGNVTYGSASTPAARHDLVVGELRTLQPGTYVIFADNANVDDYVQFMGNDDGGLLMEVASGAYGNGHGHPLAGQHLAEATLGALGLHAKPGENFCIDDLHATPAEIAEWIETIFLNLFRAGDEFTLEALGAPGRVAAPAD